MSKFQTSEGGKCVSCDFVIYWISLHLIFCLAMICGFIVITSAKNKDTSQHRAKCPYRLLIQLQTVVLLILEVHSEFPEQSVRVSIIF